MKYPKKLKKLVNGENDMFLNILVKKIKIKMKLK